MKRLVTVLFVVSLLLLSFAPSVIAATPTPPATASATATTATSTTSVTPSGAPTGTTAVSTPARGAPPVISTVPTPQACAANPPAADKTPLAIAGSNGVEVATRRTRTSRTFAPKPGPRTKGAPTSLGATVVVAPGSLNFRDANGAWQPIDNALVASGGVARNTANRYTLSLPADLGGSPVRVESGGASVAMTLAGAKGTGAICGETETFANALPGVIVAYSARNDAVEETLTLASAAAPHVFVYHLTVGGGVTAKANGAGIDFVDGAGKARFAFVPPFMEDTAGAHSAAVTLTLGQDAGGQTVTLDADAKWLGDPARAFPVAIDPTVGFSGSDGGDAESNNLDCPISAATPTTAACTGTTDAVGWDGTSARRALVQFNLGSVLPATAQVLYAEIGLHKASQSTSNATTLALYPLTRAWTTGATWNAYDGTHAWTTAGGDYGTTAIATNSTGADGGGWWNFGVTTATQGWLSGATTNNGVVVKEPTENVTNVIQISSSRATNATYWPYLTIQYHAQLGEQRFYSLLGQRLSDRMDLQVNAVTGNLVVHNRDLHVAGTGLNLDIDRYFNSLTDYWDELGAGWQTNQGYDIMLDLTPFDGTVVMQGPTGEYYSFAPKVGGGYTTPPGMDATLVKNGDATFTLTYHASGLQYHFDTDGTSLLTITDRNGNHLSYTYDGSGVLTAIADTQGRAATYTHNGSGQLTKITDAASRAYQYGYTSGHLTSYTDPASKVTAYAYTGDALTQITDPVGNLTKVTYDTAGRVRTVVRVTNNGTGTGATTTFTYNTGNTVVNDANNHNTTYNYNAQAMVTSVVDGLGHTRSATYNPDNNVLTYTDAISPTGNVTNLTYGANNGESLTQLQLPTGATATLAYTDSTHPYLPSGNTDAQGNQFAYAYNTPGNRLSTTNQLPANNVTSATYNANGTVATTTDAMSHQTTDAYTYTSGKLSQIVITPPTVSPNPLGAVTLTIDTLGRVASRVDGKSQTTTFTYDTLNRTTRITYNGDTGCASRTTCTDYGYDFNGNLTSVIDGTGTTSFTYDKQNHQLTKTLPGAGSASVTYTYDGVGNLATVADSGGTVTYHYNAANLLDTLTEPGTPGPQTTFTYNNNNRRLTTSYPNGVVLTQAYDNSGRLTSITGTKGATTLTSFSYTYLQSATDRALRQTMVTGGVTTTYSYDAINRLTRANATGNDFQYTYDGSGNRLTATLNGTSTFATPTYNAVDELTALGTTTLGYDGNGNETGRSTGLTALAYNSKDQTTSMTNGTALTMTYTGDSQVERLTAGSDSFAYSATGLSARTNGGTTYYTRTNGGRLVSERLPSGGGTYYYLFDGLGSVVALTDSSGNVANTYSYDPYGNLAASTGSVANPWRYTGGYFDSGTGLYKLGQRYYDPSLGRFTQRDPRGSRYVYAGDNPINFIDPSGLDDPSGGGGTTNPNYAASALGVSSQDMGYAIHSIKDANGIPPNGNLSFDTTNGDIYYQGENVGNVYDEIGMIGGPEPSSGGGSGGEPGGGDVGGGGGDCPCP